MPTILLLIDQRSFTPELGEAVKQIAPAYDLWVTPTPEKDDPDRLDDVEISAGGRPPDALLRSPKLAWHHQLTTGVDWLNEIASPQELGFVITNVAGVHARQVSEHAFALLLSLARDLSPVHANKMQKRWALPRTDRIFSLAGKTMLILGLGNAGSRIARIAKAYDMRVLGVRRRPERSDPNVDRIAGSEELDTLIPEADAIVNVLPGTAETRNILGQKQIGAMKQSSVLINLGRGTHVDESALIEALQKGEIAGAGLDTFEVEPLPESSPLWELDNVVVSPHFGGFSRDNPRRQVEIFVQNLMQYVNGGELVNVVDKALKY